MKVLVVDDHKMTRTMVKDILKGSGFTEIIQAENGLLALKSLELEDGIELIVCDWNMPGVTGLEVLRGVRSNEKTKDLPFLMLTAEAYRENVHAAVEAGVDDYIVKPFTANVLIEKVENVLKRKK